MKKIVGVHLNIVENNGKEIMPLLKRASLFYDEIAIPSLNGNLNFFKEVLEFTPESIKEFEFLMKENIIFDSNPFVRQLLKNSSNENAIIEFKSLEIFAQNLYTSAKKYYPLNLRQYNVLSRKGAEIISRAHSLSLNEFKDFDAVPIVNKFTSEIPNMKQRRSDVIELIIKKFPVIDVSTPWEKIIEFKRDRDAREKYLALRVLISEMVNSNMKINEIDEKLEYLINEYEKHILLHKMKTTTSIMETLVVSSAEFIESLVKLKFGSASKILFKMRHKEIELLESELKISHREIAYINRVRNDFA